MTRRSGAGPAPDPSSLREVARQEAGLVRTLPKERVGALPAWPLPTPASDSEYALWAALWVLPQAIVWEEQNVQRAVARYVRMALKVDSGDVPAAVARLVMEQERILLLELGALLKAGYRVTALGSPATSKASSRTAADLRRAAIPSARGRLRALEAVPDPRTRLRGSDGDA